MSQVVEPPLTLAEVMPIVSVHLDRFDRVLRTAWATYRTICDEAGAQIGQASPGAKGMLVSDFVHRPAHDVFSGVGGISIDDRYGRPWVSLDGGRVQVRFKKLTPSLQVCSSDSDRQVRLSYHLGDPCLPGIPDATVLTAGYVLGAAGTSLTGTYLVCHVGDELLFSIPLPQSRSVVQQLPILPLSAPIIRSARNVVRDRLGRDSGTA